MKKKSNFLGKKVGEAVAEKAEGWKEWRWSPISCKNRLLSLQPSKSFFLEKLESNLSSSSHNKKNCFFFSSSFSSLLLAQLSERNLLSNCNPVCLQGKEGKGKRKMIDLYEPQRLLKAEEETEKSASSSETAEKLYKILRGEGRERKRQEEELKKVSTFLTKTVQVSRDSH